jgi:hypothetical protein
MWRGEQADVVVYQRAMAWWRRRRADHRSANARWVRVISPLAACWARRVSLAVSATGLGGSAWRSRRQIA